MHKDGIGLGALHHFRRDLERLKVDDPLFLGLLGPTHRVPGVGHDHIGPFYCFVQVVGEQDPGSAVSRKPFGILQCFRIRIVALWMGQIISWIPTVTM